nr:uncharacterized protein LOC129276135 [Lytechinus pictus]
MNPSEEGGSYDSDSGASSSSSSPPSPPRPAQPSPHHLNHHNIVKPHLPPQTLNSTISPPPLPLLPTPLQHTSPPLLPLNHHQSLLGKVQLPPYIAEKLPLLTNNHLMQENNRRMLLKDTEMKPRDHHHHHHQQQRHHRSPSLSPSNHTSPPVYIPEDVILPPEFELQESCIQEAGLGVFSLVDIPQGRKFGPFTGVEKSSVTDTQYAWEVRFESISLFDAFVFAGGSSDSLQPRLKICTTQWQ